ncbi:MAG: hypothetical protein WD651_06410 [Acidimicrobiia bacterium]
MFVDLEVGPFRLRVATTYGPRILGLRRAGGPELFAQLAETVVIDHPETGIYRFHGGHRLWAAPEVPRITHVNDDRPCEVTTTTSGFTLSAPADPAGMTKKMEVMIDGERLTVDHHLGNEGPASLTVGVWAITQLPLGGIAIMPVGGPPAPNPYLADGSLIVWPYTNLTDNRLSWTPRAAVVDAIAGPRFKIGSGPRPGRLGYLNDGFLFIKEIPPAGAGDYPDRGAVAQVFVEDEFCELESLGPLALLEPGQSISHRETWEATECTSLTPAFDRVLDSAVA